MGFGPWEVVIVLVILVIIFGAGRLTQVSGAVGKGVREFRSAVQWTDGLDGLAGKLHGDRVAAGKIGKLRGANVNGIALNGVLPERVVIGRRAVTYALKVLRQVVGTPDLAR